jgi:hypothetical protein
MTNMSYQAHGVHVYSSIVVYFVCTYGVYISHLIQYQKRTCFIYGQLLIRDKLLINILVLKGFLLSHLQISLRSLYVHYSPP